MEKNGIKHTCNSKECDKTQMELQIETLQEEVRALKADNKELQRQYIELAKSIK